jgi:hypothetical protein
MPDTMQADDPQRYSGVASNMLQKAGMAELGSFIKFCRNWKLRVYRAIWNIIRTTWTNERWLRVDAGNPALPQTTFSANHGTSVSAGYRSTTLNLMMAARRASVAGAPGLQRQRRIGDGHRICRHV